VIINDLPLSRTYFDAYGDIGYRYADDRDIADVILAAWHSLANGAYEAKLRNLRRASVDRGIDASAARFRHLVRQHAPGPGSL
jgi:hypothetical protein